MVMFNTKTCKSFSETTPEAKLKPNKFIPDDLMMKKEEEEDAERKKNNNKTPEDEKELGRGLFFQPTLFLTPILSSLRPTTTTTATSTSTTDEKQPKEERRLLDKDGVDHLCEELEKCFLSNTKKNKKTEEESTSSITDDESTSSSETEIDQPSSEESLGRVPTTTFNYRTCETYKVRRSARIAKKY